MNTSSLFWCVHYWSNLICKLIFSHFISNLLRTAVVVSAVCTVYQPGCQWKHGSPYPESSCPHETHNAEIIWISALNNRNQTRLNLKQYKWKCLHDNRNLIFLKRTGWKTCCPQSNPQPIFKAFGQKLCFNSNSFSPYHSPKAACKSLFTISLYKNHKPGVKYKFSEKNKAVC